VGSIPTAGSGLRRFLIAELIRELVTGAASHWGCIGQFVQVGWTPWNCVTTELTIRSKWC
jgi:hypothetical protein